ncbi:MAG: hypothetical protein Q9168_000205 [Polycauliona sp. 1 TL-2023]
MEDCDRPALSSIPNLAGDDVQGHSSASVAPTAKETLSWEMILPRTYGKSYQKLGSPSSGYEELGHGAWSNVYRAIETPEAPLSTLPTPASSPVNSPGKPGVGRVLAIKAPARKAAAKILYREARILTYLHYSPRITDYVVPFYGYDPISASLVMNAVPLNLEMHAKACLKTATANFSTKTMFDPICGFHEWQSLATQLIDGLEFLHSNSCIHGDIKPSNILLHPNKDGSSKTYTALYCDFSSSRIMNGSKVSNTEQAQPITALTPDYASPELLTSLHSTDAVATTTADVYALAVTLVVAAIGESPYAGTAMALMKLSMAREGDVLYFAKQAAQGTRIMKGKLVERCLTDALKKDVAKRSTAVEWKRSVHAIFEG